MYIGRFAPSPTGPLHMGSLLAAVISYFDAKAHDGQWLVRIEDIDPPREQPGAAHAILNTLEAHHLYWDGDVLYQSQQHEAYQTAIDQLLSQGDIYPCQCSRKQLTQFNEQHLHTLPHPDQCIQPLDPKAPYALRAKPADFSYQDLYQGIQQGQDGHFVVKRRDQLFAYQLAVVVDDHEQHISHVIRGHDLLDSTPKQLILYQALGYQPPVFGHFPVIVGDNGQKLSKQNFAPAIDDTHALANLKQVFHYLAIPIPETSDLDEFLKFGCEQWKAKRPDCIKAQTIQQNH
ncbi:tRNA glutamyl-Q(34) synthetase GluQRS [Litoribrevibacter euphylliae]|uniref:tRNA glutamyl-Q(34) synthetase GluQRS n=1 Tax=Litoribrevibacter euphylliae TaxID=1834034 RepID=A0ABV7HHT5_9GAMM